MTKNDRKAMDASNKAARNYFRSLLRGTKKNIKK